MAKAAYHAAKEVDSSPPLELQDCPECELSIIRKVLIKEDKENQLKLYRVKCVCGYNYLKGEVIQS